MRALGVVLTLLGAAALVGAVREIFVAHRPRDVAAAAVAVVAVAALLGGLVLVVAPDAV